VVVSFLADPSGKKKKKPVYYKEAVFFKDFDPRGFAYVKKLDPLYSNSDDNPEDKSKNKYVFKLQCSREWTYKGGLTSAIFYVTFSDVRNFAKAKNAKLAKIYARHFNKKRRRVGVPL
jgi:hypothetical protein